MTEIKIEKKKLVWPWVLIGLLLLGLLLYFVVFRDNDNKVYEAENTAAVAPVQEINPGAVADYAAFVNGTQTMGLDHNFTNGALTRLAAAVQAKASQMNYTIRADIDRVQDLANHITQDPNATTHADSIRRAAGLLATVLQNIQQASHPNLSAQAQEVRQASEAIDPDVLALDQKETIRAFFDKASQLLQQMN